MPNDITPISEITRDLAYRQIDAQLQSSSGYETKAIGISKRRWRSRAVRLHTTH
jgi:hypothetical protein